MTPWTGCHKAQSGGGANSSSEVRLCRARALPLPRFPAAPRLRHLRRPRRHAATSGSRSGTWLAKETVVALVSEMAFLLSLLVDSSTSLDEPGRQEGPDAAFIGPSYPLRARRRRDPYNRFKFLHAGHAS